MSETKVIDPMQKLVKVKLPKTRDQKDAVYVRVNERTWLIQRGVEVEVPLAVAEQLAHQERMLAEAWDFEESAAERFNG